MTTAARRMSRMTGDAYDEGYWERGEGSNYVQYGDDPRWAMTASLLMAEAPLPGDVKPWLLEVACAKGYFVKAAKAEGFEAYGIDISDWAVQNADPSIRRRLVLGNAVDLPWGDHLFDVVCSWEFFEHVYENEIPNVLDEMLRVLKPGGLLVHRIGIDMEDGQDTSGQQHDHTHVWEVNRAWWEALFGNRGLSRSTEIEAAFDWGFEDSDWKGRFFAYWA